MAHEGGMNMSDKLYNELTFNGLKIIIQESDCRSGIIVDYWTAKYELHMGTETFWYDDIKELEGEE